MILFEKNRSLQSNLDNHDTINKFYFRNLKQRLKEFDINFSINKNTSIDNNKITINGFNGERYWRALDGFTALQTYNSYYLHNLSHSKTFRKYLNKDLRSNSEKLESLLDGDKLTKIISNDIYNVHLQFFRRFSKNQYETILYTYGKFIFEDARYEAKENKTKVKFDYCLVFQELI